MSARAIEREVEVVVGRDYDSPMYVDAENLLIFFYPIVEEGYRLKMEVILGTVKFVRPHGQKPS